MVTNEITISDLDLSMYKLTCDTMYSKLKLLLMKSHLLAQSLYNVHYNKNASIDYSLCASLPSIPKMLIIKLIFCHEDCKTPKGKP